MAGILKTIQKKSNKKEIENSLSPVVSELPKSSGSPEKAPSTVVLRSKSGTGSIDRRKVEAEKLLSDLVNESAGKPVTKPGTPSNRVVKRAQLVRTGSDTIQKEGSLPDWEKPSSKFPKALEPALAVACRTIKNVLREAGSIPENLEHIIREYAGKAIVNFDSKMGWKEQDLIIREISALFDGYGPLEMLFKDQATTEIFVDSHRSIKVRRKGQVIETPFSFRNAEELELFAISITRSTGKFLSRENPILDCVLDENSQALVNALHGSLAGASEPRISIRIPRVQKVSFYELLQSKTLPATLAAWLAEVVSQGDANILIVGPASSAKTMLISALASEVGSDERVITVEELPEIQASTSHLEKLVAKPGDNFSDRNNRAVTVAELIKAAVRRHPRRLILGDLKDDDVREYIRALESGLAGCIASINGEYPEDGLWRLLDLLTLSEQAPQFSLMRRIVRSFHIVISIQVNDDKPCIVEVAEVLPLKGMEFTVLPLVQLESMEEGKRIWRIVAEDSYWLRRVAERGSGLRSGPALLPFDEIANFSSGEQ